MIAQDSPAMRALTHPEADDVAWGAVAAWLIFSPLAGLAVGLWFLFTSAVEYVVPAVVMTLLFATVVGGVITLLGVVSASLVARILERVPHWQVHLASYFLLGALTGLATVLLLTGFTLFVWADATLPTFAMVLAGVSVALGWALSWRRAARRGDMPPAPEHTGPLRDC